MQCVIPDWIPDREQSGHRGHYGNNWQMQICAMDLETL